MRSVAVEAHQTSVIAELDRLLQIGGSTKFIKERLLEPQCEKCLWNLHIEPAIKLSGKIRKLCDVGQVVLVRSMEIELIVSDRIRSIFESEEISGLAYQPIEDSSFYLLFGKNHFPGVEVWGPTHSQKYGRPDHKGKSDSKYIPLSGVFRYAWWQVGDKPLFIAAHHEDGGVPITLWPGTLEQ